MTLVEGAPPRKVALPLSVAQAMAESEVALVQPTLEPGIWQVAAARKVGSVTVGNLQVLVAPKMRIDRLIFLLGYSRNPDFWRDHDVRVDIEAELPEALADAFARQATWALEQGLLHGYVETEDSLSVLRGRFRVGDQIARHHGRLIPLEVRFDEFTVDIAENQLLLATTLRLLQLPIAAEPRRALQRLRLLLSDVTPPWQGQALPPWQPTRLNRRLQPALQLAEVVLAGNSFEHRFGEVQVSGFMFDMWRIFEDFVCVALREALAPFGGASSLQYRTHLDKALAVGMKPDFVWSSGGAPRVVVDAKYKAEKYAGFPQADLYQLLAYCTVLGLSSGHLIYAKGSETSGMHKIRGVDVTVHQHALNLSQPRRELLAGIDELAAQLVEGGV
ncbi:restriction endonuclease [Knoellia sp. S7-12]|uniref:McrC family protein n=1 Tax=Knoellia sp. S7-12 TaxID=3126698 RepID=UPI0033667D40